MLHLDAGYLRATQPRHFDLIKGCHFDFLQSAMPPTEKYCLNKLRCHILYFYSSDQIMKS